MVEISEKVKAAAGIGQPDGEVEVDLTEDDGVALDAE